MTTLSSSFEQSQDSSVPEPEYRSAKQLPITVWDQCIIYFEESLHLQALTLLNDAVIAGLPAIHDGERNLVFVPPPFVLAFASTVSVHPLLTTRAGSSEGLDAANLALELLRNTFALAGPLNAEAAAAFAFAEQADAIAHNRGLPRSKGKRKSDVRNSQNQHEVGNENEYAINTRLAKESSIWASAEDFWHVVGWAFICSLRYPTRWERWQPWLEMMVETLEQDWRARVKVYKSADSSLRDKEMLRESMIMQYLLGAKISGATPGGRRRILRAILASGDEQSMREFRQVFKDETKEKRKQDVHDFLNKSRKLDLEQGDYGDYGDDEEEEDDLGSEEEILAQHNSLVKQESNGSGRRKRRSGRGPTAVDSGTSTPPIQSATSRTAHGDIDSWLLRRRLIFLLTLVPDQLSDEFASHEDIYDVLTEFTRPLPLPIFTFMISPSDNPARASVLASWLKWLLYALGNGPRDESPYVDQSIMQKYHLPYAARHNTLVDNARMAITLEALVRLLQNTSTLQSGLGFRDAVETGIAARLKKAEGAASYGAKAATAETGELWVWLRFAEDGLRNLANQAENGEGPTTT